MLQVLSAEPIAKRIKVNLEVVLNLAVVIIFVCIYWHGTHCTKASK